MAQSRSSAASKTLAAALFAFAFAAVCLLGVLGQAEAKFLRRSRYFDDSPYSMGAGSTGERAILTVRGARNPYDGSAPSKIAIQDEPWRGAYPRGLYDRLDAYGQGARYPRAHLGGYMGRPEPYIGPSGYNSYSNFGAMYGAPNRIAVTGAFPYGYGSRF